MACNRRRSSLAVVIAIGVAAVATACTGEPESTTAPTPDTSTEAMTVSDPSINVDGWEWPYGRLRLGENISSGAELTALYAACPCRRGHDGPTHSSSTVDVAGIGRVGQGVDVVRHLRRRHPPAVRQPVPLAERHVEPVPAQRRQPLQAADRHLPPDGRELERQRRRRPALTRPRRWTPSGWPS
jgi:hypothetical protein